MTVSHDITAEIRSISLPVSFEGNGEWID